MISDKQLFSLIFYFMSVRTRNCAVFYSVDICIMFGKVIGINVSLRSIFSLNL